MGGALQISWWGPGVEGLKGLREVILMCNGTKNPQLYVSQVFFGDRTPSCAMIFKNFSKILNCIYHKFFLGRSPSLFNDFQKKKSKKPQLYLVNDHYINIKTIYITGFF